MTNLTLAGVSKNFGKVKAISNINVEIKSGEFFVLLGPSGAGKTTTLRMIAGLEKPDTGRVLINDRNVNEVSPALRDVAFVFQQYSLYPHLNVFENLAFPLRSPLRKMDEVSIKQRVEKIARILHIEDKLDNPATKLSGGQMQRVAIGRALVRQPSAYLMDEPLSSLDAKLRDELRLELKRIQQDSMATMLYVTHDQIEAMTLANRIGVLDQGVLIQTGTPKEIYENPYSTAVATRLGMPRINLMPVKFFPELGAPPGATTLGIRAEKVQFVPNGKITAHIKRTELLSDLHLAHLAISNSDIEFIAVYPDNLQCDSGIEVKMDFIDPFFFDASGNRIY